MTRPHIEFIFAQALPWRAASPLEQRKELQCKVLSEDAQNGEVSLILRVPRGWNKSINSDYQEEMYVLDGAIEFDGQRLCRDGYARIDAGRETRWQAQESAVLLICSNAASWRQETGELAVIDTVVLPWDRDGVPKELQYMGIARKVLFVDQDSGRHRTWLLATSPQSLPKGKQLERETHACAEELFMLSGEITGPHGIMSRGAYFWRPAETLHGPFGSREGNLAFCRFRHGAQITTFHRDTLPFVFDAPYEPAVPSEMSHLRAQQGPFLERY
jgi:hypothetical protein